MSEPITPQHQHLGQWRDRLQDLVDQALTPSETLQVHAHLASCPVCTREHQRLVSIDARLRDAFRVAATPSSDFEQRVLAHVTSLEQDRRSAARQREQAEHEARLARLRNGWRELARFHLGNIIGVIATLVAVTTALVSTLPALTSAIPMDLAGAKQVAWLPHGWDAALPMTLIASAAFAAAAIWITRRLDRHSS